MKAKVLASTEGMSREKWLKLRSKGIGGSDAGTIVGVNPYQSAYALWASKTGLVPDTFTGNAATEWGNRLERSVAEAYAEETNSAVVSWPVMLQGSWDWQLANVDFFIVFPSDIFEAGKVTDTKDEPDNIIAILECKTTGIVGRGNARGWDNDMVPPSYYWQGAHYAATTGIYKVVFACLIGSVGLVIREREYASETLFGLEQQEYIFWQKVLAKTEPELTGHDSEFDTLKAIYPESTEEAVEVDRSIANLVSDYRLAKSELAQVEAKVSAIRVQLEAVIGNAAEATYFGQTLYTYKSTKPTLKFDDKTFKSENPDLWAKYATERPGYRTLRVKGE